MAIRDATRRVLAGLLKFVPLACLQPLRVLHMRTRPSTLRGRLVRAVLEVVRHRPLPAREFRPLDAPDALFLSEDSLVLQRVFWFGASGYEGRQGDWWALLCGRAERVLEIGANAGYYTVRGGLSLRPGARYVAVEAHPRAAALLRRHIELNRIPVEVVEAAAVGDDAPAGMSLRISSRDHYAVPAGGTLLTTGRPTAEMIEVSTHSARELFAHVDLCKLDIEGFEEAVLSAVREDLVRRRPALLVEVLGSARGLAAFLHSLVEDAGYDVYSVATERLRRLDPECLLSTRSVAALTGVRDVLLATPDWKGGLPTELPHS